MSIYASLLPLTLDSGASVKYTLDGVILDCNPGVVCAGRISLNAFRSWLTPASIGEEPVRIEAIVDYRFPFANNSIPLAFTVIYDTVTSPGDTTITTTTTAGGDLPDGFPESPYSPYFDIATDAEYVGPVVVCSSYTFVSDVDTACSQQLLHKSDSSSDFVDYAHSRERAVPLDKPLLCDNCISIGANRICGVVNDLSPFAVVLSPEPVDNCPDVSNPEQTDTDGDGLVTPATSCPEFSNPEQRDSDEDGAGDVCDVCAFDADNDADGDGVCGDVDQCIGGDDTLDSDGDGAADFCDACPYDLLNDVDGDGVCGDVDQCPDGDDNLDADGDAVADACDICPGGDDNLDADGDSVPDFCDPCPEDELNDADRDGVCGNDETLPGRRRQPGCDGDSVPDFCDLCWLDFDNDIDGDGLCGDVDDCPFDAANDADGDGVCGDVDQCAGGDDNLDTDGDGTADFCDACPYDLLNDVDGDGICETDDNCDVDPTRIKPTPTATASGMCASLTRMAMAYSTMPTTASSTQTRIKAMPTATGLETLATQTPMATG